MNHDDYQNANLQAVFVANTIEVLPLAEMREAQERAHAVGPIVDPTLYRDKMDDLQIDCERTRILLDAQRKLKDLRARANARRAARRNVLTGFRSESVSNVE